MLTVPKLKTGLVGIYLLRNNDNSKFYIGSSTCIRTRLTQHKNDLENTRHHNTRLNKDYVDNNGNFSSKVLVRCAVHELHIYEQSMLDIFYRHFPSYHLGKNVM